MSEAIARLVEPVVKEGEKANEKAKIVMKEYASFDGGMVSKFMSVGKLSNKVSSMFASMFGDFYGSKIEPNNGMSLTGPSGAYTIPKDQFFPENELKVTLYFKFKKEVPAGTKQALKIANVKKATPVTVPGTMSSFAASISRDFGGNVNNAGGTAFTVDEAVLEGLEVFLPNGAHPNWYKYRIFEQPIGGTDSLGSYEVVVGITGLSLNKILTYMYGDKTDEGRYQYAAEISSMFTYQGARTLNQLILCVTRLEESEVRELQKLTGFNVYQPDGINVFGR